MAKRKEQRTKWTGRQHSEEEAEFSQPFQKLTTKNKTKGGKKPARKTMLSGRANGRKRPLGFRERLPGENFWSWYREYLLCESWKQKRRIIIKRAKGKCEQCGNHLCTLQVHHKTYLRVGREKPSDLQALCETCHAEKHDRDISLPPMPDKPK